MSHDSYLNKQIKYEYIDIHILEEIIFYSKTI